MTREEWTQILIEHGWKMNAFGHYVKDDRVVRFRNDEVNFGKGWYKIDDFVREGNKLVYTGGKSDD